MEALFLKLVNMSITASWLVLVILAVRLIFRKTPKWILCLLWGLVAVRLVCPFSIESALSLIPDAEPLTQDVIFTAEPVKQAHGEVLDSHGNVVLEQIPPAAKGEVLDSSGNIVLEKNAGAVSDPGEAQTQTWIDYLTGIWLVGICVMLVYTLVSYYLLKRKVATAIPVGKGIKQSEFVDSPFVLGLIRPVIYLPFDMAEGDMAYVLAHEKAHIRRRDHWWKPLGFGLLSVYWFHPLLWLAYILLCRDIEAACDEKVIRDMDKDDRRAYSTALLNCSIHRRSIAACPLAFGETGVKARVKGVMHYKKPAFWFVIICLLLVILVSVCFLTNPETALPVTMQVDYFSRTRADLHFYYDDSFPEGTFEVTEGYALEVQENGKWFEIGNLSDEQPAEPVHGVAAQDPDFDAWSSINWEAHYGPLPDGVFRIRKDLTAYNNFGGAETYPFYVEFTIGGTADDYITYTLEDITPTGAKLYEHETVDENTELIYDGSEGFWLEAWQDGQWKYLEPTKFIEPSFREERHFIYQLVYPSQYTQLDWSSLYGSLPAGSYRIGREITVTSGSDLRHCTVYGEFSIDNVYTWFDRYSADPEDFRNYTGHIELTGTDGVMLQVDTNDNIQLSEYSGDRYGTVIESGLMARNVFLTDLTGDGISEICATTSSASAPIRIQVYDYASDALYKLEDEKIQYILTKKADRLVVLENENGFTTGFGQLALQDGKLEIREIDRELLPLTKSVSCVDVWTRKRTCLSSQNQVNDAITLLRNLENKVQPASEAEVAAAQEEGLYISYIVINYGLGEKNIHFSKNFDIIWEYGSREGYRLTDPEPIRKFVESVTDGVRGREVSGEPFATMDVPWDWCEKISTNAVESAQLHVCLSTYGSGNISGSTSTSGFISYETLQGLIDVLNQIPQSSFVPGKMTSKESYHNLFVNQTKAQNASFSIVDGVNDLGVIISCGNGKLTMLLTDEMEKVKAEDLSYLEPTQLWTVQDEKLLAFMQSVTENPQVINYSVGAEYEWQKALDFASGDFTMRLWLIEGWESEYVTEPSHFGIRCHPEGVSEGWIYFSFWPGGYDPQEEDRYYQEVSYTGYRSVTSYPSNVSSRMGVDTRNAVWSYQRDELPQGDFAVINDGADAWFLEYKDQIEDTVTLCNYSPI